MEHILGIRRCRASYNFHKEFYLVHRIGLTMLVFHPLYSGKIYFLISMEYTLLSILNLQWEPPWAFLPSVLCIQCFFWYSKLYCVHNLYVSLPAETAVHTHIVLFVIISMLILVKSITDKNLAEFITALGRPYVVNHEFPKGKTNWLRNTTNCDDVLYIWLYIVITAVGFWSRKNHAPN